MITRATVGTTARGQPSAGARTPAYQLATLCRVDVNHGSRDAVSRIDRTSRRRDVARHRHVLEIEEAEQHRLSALRDALLCLRNQGDGLHALSVSVPVYFEALSARASPERSIGWKQRDLVPLITLTPADLNTSLLNILLLVPFGFGLPFLATWRVKKVVCIGALFSSAIECLQAITGAVAHMTFRIADINDVLFNTAGAAIGYMLFVGFVRLCRHTAHNWEMPANPILRYLARDR